MTLPVNYQQQPMPNHSGITINISNPVMNPPGCCSHQQYTQQNMPQMQPTQYNNGYNQQPTSIPQQGYQMVQPQSQVNYQTEIYPQAIPQGGNQAYNNYGAPAQQQQNMSYPPQYYMNNYNYINTPANNNGQPFNIDSATASRPADIVSNPTEATPSTLEENNTDNTGDEKAVDSDLSLSKEIISNIDEKKAAEAAKNEKKVKVVALTNEYIMSLENYLNNPNNDIRYTAAKEILTRLDEDRSRHNDAALNALLNKMLQDPDKSIRVAAMSAFSSELASGNEFTIKLLKDIQNNPNSDKDDVVEAANILLKMSSSTEYKYVPMNNENVEPQQQVMQ